MRAPYGVNISSFDLSKTFLDDFSRSAYFSREMNEKSEFALLM